MARHLTENIMEVETRQDLSVDSICERRWASPAG